jgi:hypothetical protein
VENEDMMVRLETVRAAIDLEPELPGDIPDEMWDALRNDRDAMRQALVIAVKETKAGIKSRLADFINEGR